MHLKYEYLDMSKAGDAMDSEKLRDISIKSCKAYYRYVKDSGMGRDEIKTTYKYPKDGILSLKLSGKLYNIDGLMLCIDGKDYRDPDVKIQSYNEISNQLVVSISYKVLNILSDMFKHDIKVVTDLSWLILSAKNYYESYGDRIRYPERTPCFHKRDCTFSDGYRLLPDQENAIRIALNSKLSYVWGAPGTGKTQCVLTTCVMSYIMKGKRVAIIAPTNNALDHVLKGVLREIGDNYRSTAIKPENDVIRLGTATSEFFKEYPQVCTSNTVSKELSFKKYTLEDLCNTRNSKTAESMKPAFMALKELIKDCERAPEEERTLLRQNILTSFNSIRKRVDKIHDFEYLLKDLDEFNVCERIKQVIRILYNNKDFSENEKNYAETNKTVDVWIREYKNQIAELETSKITNSINKAKIIAMTPQTMMLHFGPDDLKVDHIFIDEANYSSVINILPFFTFGVPITMCGDHMQLPPVCVIDRKEIVRSIESKKDEKYCIMWSMNALYAESFLFRNLGGIVQDYIDNRPFVFDITEQANLTTSYRFGNNLAMILDKHVYHNGVIGVGKNPVKVVVVNAVCIDRGKNENEAEAEAIIKLIKHRKLKKNEYAILTPYRNQVKLIKHHPMKSQLDHSPNVMTIHSSEGKEWDTIILSIVDDKPGKLMTSTTKKDGPGLNTINTAVSRAKKHIVIVCNEDFWREMDGELITDLIKSGNISKDLSRDYS